VPPLSKEYPNRLPSTSFKRATMTSSLIVILSYRSCSKQIFRSAFDVHLGAWIQATAYGRYICSPGENVSRRRALQTAVLTSISALVPALAEAPASTGIFLNYSPIQLATTSILSIFWPTRKSAGGMCFGLLLSAISLEQESHATSPSPHFWSICLV
jgi:hypothetical protein